MALVTDSVPLRRFDPALHADASRPQAPPSVAGVAPVYDLAPIDWVRVAQVFGSVALVLYVLARVWGARRRRRATPP